MVLQQQLMLSKYANISFEASDSMIPYERNMVFELLNDHQKELNDQMEKSRLKRKK